MGLPISKTAMGELGSMVDSTRARQAASSRRIVSVSRMALQDRPRNHRQQVAEDNAVDLERTLVEQLETHDPGVR
jgi:hypothetical protein